MTGHTRKHFATVINYPQFPLIEGRAYVFYGNNKTLMDTDCDYIFDPEEPTKRFGIILSAEDFNNDGYLVPTQSRRSLRIKHSVKRL